jgi:hypothetical protein
VAGLLTSMRTVRPQTVRQFFALATQHMRWQLNDLARRLDEQPAAAALSETGVEAPPSSTYRPFAFAFLNALAVGWLLRGLAATRMPARIA